MATVLKPPTPLPPTLSQPSVFLAGSIEMGRAELCCAARSPPGLPGVGCLRLRSVVAVLAAHSSSTEAEGLNPELARLRAVPQAELRRQNRKPPTDT